MYTQQSITGLLALASVALAAPAAEYKAPTKPKCTDFIIPVTAKAPVKLLATSILGSDFSNPTVLEDFVVSEASSGLAALLGAVGTFETSGHFNMSARYCAPTVHIPERAHTIQYLQHAITNTKNYWNGLTYPMGVNGTKYSWIDIAASVSACQLACRTSSEMLTVVAVWLSHVVR